MTRRLYRCSLAVAALSLGCSHVPPQKPSAPAHEVAPRRPSITPHEKAKKQWTCARVKQARAAAFAKARAALAAARITSRYSIDAKAVGRARAQGLDRARLEQLLLGAFARRLHPGLCPSKKGKKKLSTVDKIFADARFNNAKDTEIVGRLLRLLGRVGGRRSLPLLWRLSALGYWDADSARERVLVGLMKGAIARARCTPPSAAEIATARRDLAGFVVIAPARGGRSDQLVARRPSARELDDLAYLMAASTGRGPAVGTWPERGNGNWMRRARKPSATRREWAKKLSRAKKVGDFQQVAFAARRYLESLGYPKGIRTNKVHDYSWGGARYSYVMRDLALAAETAGDVTEAAFAYRRANPGGGACGTSVSARWSDQVKGVIRTEERRGHCRAVVLERLLAIDGSGKTVYGPQRLAQAGFDVARLYRGALVARNRDLSAAKLRAILGQAPVALMQAAQARYKRRGAEAFETRVYAVEGLADTLRRAALPALVTMARHGSAAIRARALHAIAKLAVRPRHSPCDPGLFGFGMSGSSQWSRSIGALRSSCKTHLKVRARDALASKLHRLLFDKRAEVRRAAIEALRDIASQRSLAPLERVARRDKKTSTSHCSQQAIEKKKCTRRYPLRDEAKKARAQVKKLLGEIAADAKARRAKKRAQANTTKAAKAR